MPKYFSVEIRMCFHAVITVAKNYTGNKKDYIKKTGEEAALERQSNLTSWTENCVLWLCWTLQKDSRPQLFSAHTLRFAVATAVFSAII